MADRRLVRRLLRKAGPSYAEEAGIRLRDTPMPLFQLLVLCMLASKPITATVAAHAAGELFRIGLRTPRAVLATDVGAIIDALDRAHYVRYDESSAARLIDIARTVQQRYHGDLRGLAERSRHDPRAAALLLKEFTGIGDTGASIYLREVQDVWTWARPTFDRRALAVARDIGLPDHPDELSALAPDHNAALAAALVRVSRDADIRNQILAAAG